MVFTYSDFKSRFAEIGAGAAVDERRTASRTESLQRSLRESFRRLSRRRSEAARRKTTSAVEMATVEPNV